MGDRDVFELKYFESIVAGMVNQVIGSGAIRHPEKRVLTDFVVGSVLRTILEASSIEIEQLYLRTHQGIAKAIPVAIYEAFGFTREGAAPATGNATFTKSVGATGIIQVPVGTRLQTATGIEFVTIQSGFIDTGYAETDVTVAVKAVTTGPDGNVEAGSILFFVTSLSGISAVTNPQATTGGQAEESDAARKVRFQDFVSNLTRATRRAVEVGALTAQLLDLDTGDIVEQVVHARLYEPFNETDNTVANGGDGTPENYEVGYAEVWIDNGSGTTSGELLAEAQRVIDGYDQDGQRVPGWKAAGVVVEVKAVTSENVAVIVTVEMKPGMILDDDHVAVIQAAIEEYFDNLLILEKVSRENLLVAIANSSIDIYEVTLTTPSSDRAVGYNERAILTTVEINET